MHYVQRALHAWKITRTRAALESQLEFFLAMLALELEIHPRLDHAIHAAGEHSPSPLREVVLSMSAQHAQKGMPLEESLVFLSKQWSSPLLTRTTTLLAHLAHQGITPHGIASLRRMAQDLRAHHHIQTKAFTAKLTLYSLLFIGISTLVPALFLAFITIGSRFLELSLSPHDIVLISVGLFPLLDVGVLTLLWLQRPIRGENKKGPHEKSFLTQLHDQFSPVEWKRVGYASTLAGAGLFLLAWSGFLYLRAPLNGMWILLFVSAALGPFVAHVVLRQIEIENRIRTMERQLPDALSLLAALPPTVSFEKGLQWVAQSTEHPLREEWNQVCQKMTKGAEVPLALREFGARFPSRSLHKTAHVLSRGYERGAPLQVPLTTLADEILTTQSLLEEQRAQVLVEKYTLLLAGTTLVPLLLGVLVGSMDQFPVAIEGTNPEVMSTALFSVRAYLVFYAGLTGVFLGLLEGHKSRAGAYGLLFIPCAQIMYTLGRAWGGG